MRMLFIVSLVLASAAQSAAGVVTVGGLDFDSGAFADSLLSAAGPISLFGNPGSLENAVTGSDPSKFAGNAESGSGAFVELGFSNNRAVNGPGWDLAYFEISINGESFTASLFPSGTEILVPTVDTGVEVVVPDLGIRNIFVGYVDLEDLGVIPGASIQSIVVGLDPGGAAPNTPEIALVAARYSEAVRVPSANAVWMAFLGIALVASAVGLGRPTRR